jgi:FKBP-type peptidyl-prolyl cis-trans isomerase (trigger factor)
MRKMDLDALRKDILPNAENRLKHSLVLLEVAKSEGIKIEQNELESRTLRTLEELSQSLPMKEIKKINTHDFVAGLAGNIASNMMVEQTLERLRAYARGEVIEKVENPTTEPRSELEVEKDVNVSTNTTADERTENTQEAAQLGNQSTVPDSANEEHGELH